MVARATRPAMSCGDVHRRKIRLQFAVRIVVGRGSRCEYVQRLSGLDAFVAPEPREQLRRTLAGGNPEHDTVNAKRRNRPSGNFMQSVLALDRSKGASRLCADRVLRRPVVAAWSRPGARETSFAFVADGHDDIVVGVRASGDGQRAIDR